MTLNLSLPENEIIIPQIKVFGVGGAGGNAVNNMIESQVQGVEFIVANTDAQALAFSLCDDDHKIQLGINTTKGLGAGSMPEVGYNAAEESIDEIMAHLKGASMAFITAGMGGGTGTGASPVIARAAKEQDILTIGVVTLPFHFEGLPRRRIAMLGLNELCKYVDTIIIIPNQNLFRIANENTTFKDAFKLADDVLRSGVSGITDLMVMPGLINLDFADIRAIMHSMGKAMMGTGEASGENRAIQAAECAVSNPLLDITSMRGAKGVLINITGGEDMTLFEVDAAVNRIKDEVDSDANIIFGSTFNEALNGTIKVSVVATGIEEASEGNESETTPPPQQVRAPTRKITKPAYSNTSMDSSSDKKDQEHEQDECKQEEETECRQDTANLNPNPHNSSDRQTLSDEQDWESGEEEEEIYTESACADIPHSNRTTNIPEYGMSYGSHTRSHMDKTSDKKTSGMASVFERIISASGNRRAESNPYSTEKESLEVPAFLRRKNKQDR